jgi:hypothetical protein
MWSTGKSGCLVLTEKFVDWITQSPELFQFWIFLNLISYMLNAIFFTLCIWHVIRERRYYAKILGLDKGYRV